MPSRAAAPDDVESPAQFLAVAYPQMVGVPEIAIFGRDQVERVSALDVAGRVRLGHLQSRGIHVQKRAVAGHDLDAFRRRLDNRAQMLAALTRLLRGAPRRGDILETVDRAGDRALGIEQRVDID